MSASASSPFDVAGRVILVTGSSRGIGRGVAEHLAGSGASVVIHARTLKALGEVRASIAALGGEALPVAADVRDTAALQDAMAAVQSRFGRLDGVVANVGGAGFGPAATLTVERWRRQLELNLTSGFVTLQAAYPLLKAGGGAAVLVSATAATNPTPQFSAYGAAKAGTAQLVGSLAAEWGPEVRVNCISPGLIRTEGSFQAVFQGSEQLAARAGRTTAVGRIGEPSDIAYGCQYLLSAAAGYVSGATLVLDGGPTEGPTQRILRALEDDRPQRAGDG
jgi:NAD(P)-dependent dehydrogenase (short-subunit alcohol dehydrogenase family)